MTTRLESLFLFQLILHSSLLLAVLISLFILGLILLKLFRIAERHDEARLRGVMMPLLEAYLRDGRRGLPALFGKVRGYARRVLQYCLVHRSFGTRGEAHARIADAYERLGFIDRDMGGLDSPLWWVRAESIRCLGQMRCSRAKAAMLAMLQDSVLEVRLMSAWALGRTGDLSVVRPILESLASESRLAGLRLSSTVFELGEKAVEPLVSVSGHDDPAVRLLAVHLLGELCSPKALPALLERCDRREEKAVRIAAVKALGVLGDAKAVPALRSALRSGPWELRAQAAKALGRLKAEVAIPRLREAMADEHWWVRRNAGEALARMGALGVEALREVHQRSPDRHAREMGAQWLDELGLL